MGKSTKKKKSASNLEVDWNTQQWNEFFRVKDVDMIALVEDNPELWDSNNKGYMNSAMRTMRWKQIRPMASVSEFYIGIVSETDPFLPDFDR